MKELSIVRASAIAILSMTLSACGTLYELDVSAQKPAEALPGNTYVILSGDPDLPMNSAQFGEYASQLERALDTQGYTRATSDSLTEAAVAVYISADIGDPKKTYHTVSQGIYESPYMESSQAAARQTSTPGGGQSGGGASKPTVLDRQPQQELVGYKKNSFATTVYTKHLSVIAVDLQKYLADIEEYGKPNAVPRELWSLDVETTGSPDNLSEVMPVMIAAGQPYMGKKTSSQVRVSMSEGDRRVKEIKQ